VKTDINQGEGDITAEESVRGILQGEHAQQVQQAQQAQQARRLRCGREWGQPAARRPSLCRCSLYLLP